MANETTTSPPTMGVTLAVYGAICRETRRGFHFPGSREQWEAVTDVTDAGLLADHLVWAATTPAAANEALNIVNGDVFRWRRMGVAVAVLLIVGGGVYSLGAVIYATKWPDPFPRIFGFHEVFHLLVVVAAAIQFVAVSLVVI